MYNVYFNFSKRPFVSVPQVDRYFPGSTIESARQTLARCIERGEGTGLVVGPSGTGKTLLCEVLAGQFEDRFRTARLSAGRFATRRNLFQAILYELGRPYRGMDEGELRLALSDFVTASEDCPQGMLLLVDEAHTLPLRLLDEIRVLTNLARHGQPAVRLVLAGSCVLEERFASPKLDSFAQRLVARCYLESFNRTETQAYIHALVDLVDNVHQPGAGAAIFSEKTCQSVHQATDGVPRLINQVCDHALLLAHVAGRHQVEPADVQEAWADLQQLPTPWNAESPNESPEAAVIEFGGLDDQPGEVAQPRSEGARPFGGGSFQSPPDGMPPLRISPDTSQPGAAAADPAKQLARIEGMLADVEEDFQPTGSFGPEVELVFDGPGKPFHEEFAEEEVVADRYAPPAEAPPAEPPPEPVPAAEEPETPAESHEADLIVVEDDYDDVTPPPGPVIAVRRQEYGRLFAKLRRG